MKLSPHFTFEELIVSDKAKELGLDNTPDSSLLPHMQVLAAGLEKVRALLGDSPIHVNSGYRSPEVNAAIGGSKRSAHMDGYAADFVCPGFGSPLLIVRHLRDSGLQFDQLIMEHTWVHISFDPKNRREVLTAHFTPGKPTTYTEGA